MVSMTVELRNVEDTQAAMGWAGGHTIIVDRPEGKAGGMDGEAEATPPEKPASKKKPKGGKKK